MADNITLPGAASIVATDEVGGFHFQRMKVTHGVDGVAVDVSQTNPLPVTQNDCVTLLSTTLAVTGASASIDTAGYGAIVVQLSGLWQGSSYFEASNDGTQWDAILTFSRDNLCLQDIITAGGIFTVRPSGRYLRLIVTSITGTITINAIGRSAEGIDAADLLSLAMDRANNTPMHVSLDDLSFQKLSPIQPLTQIGFYSMVGVIAINTQIMTVDVSAYRSLSMQWATGTACVITPEWSNDGTAFFPATTFDQANNAGTTLPAASSGLRITNVIAKYLRLRVTTAASALLTQVVLMGGTQPMTAPLTTQPVSGSVTATLASTTVTASTPATPTASILSSAATTNGTIAKGSAGTIYSVVLTNTGGANAFFKLHNSATVTVGTTAVALTVTIPPSGTVSVEFGAMGMRYGTGICYSITNLVADTDTTAVTLNQVKVNLAFI